MFAVPSGPKALLAVLGALFLTSLLPYPAAAGSPAPDIDISSDSADIQLVVDSDIQVTTTVKDYDTIDTSGGPQLDDDLPEWLHIGSSDSAIAIITMAIPGNWDIYVDPNTGDRYGVMIFKVIGKGEGVCFVTEKYDDQPELLDDDWKSLVHTVHVTQY